MYNAKSITERVSTMKKTIGLIALFSILLSAFAVSPVFAADKDFARVDVSGSDKTYNSGEVINVVVKITDVTLGDYDGVSAFTFYFHYDDEKVIPVATPTLDSDGDNFNFIDIVNAAPVGWEAIGKLDEENCYYDLAFSEFTGEHLVTNNNPLILTLPFTVKEETKVDDIVFNMTNIEFYNSDITKCYAPADFDVVVTYAMQPDELVTLPNGAIPLDVAGYQDGENVVYYAADETTVLDYLAKFDADATMSDYGIVIVDANGEVTYADVSDADKSSVVIPKGSYILGVSSSNTSDFNALSDAASVGATVELYNLNVEATASVTSATALNQVGFVISEKSLVVEDGAKINYDEENATLKVFGAEIEIDDFKEMFKNDITVLDKNGNEVTSGFVKTGMTVAYGDGVTILIMGDVDCNGKISALDYSLLKRHIIGAIVLTGAAYDAACVTGGSKPRALDYAAVKRHVIGTLDISGYYKP